MFKCLNNSNKENVITIQGARATDASNPFASILFQNFDKDTELTYNMVCISCLDHFGDTSNNGSGDLIFKTAYTGGSNLQEQMRVMFNGNVLIGSNISRDMKLNVGGSIQALGFCNLLVDSTSNISLHHAPTCRALTAVADISLYASNTLNSITSNINVLTTWNSNTAAWASNTAQTALDAMVFGSNLLLDTYWASNIAIPWTSNTAVFASNIGALSSNTAYTSLTIAENASNTSIWASNTAKTALDASMFASNVVITSYWNSNTATFGSNTGTWLSNESLPWTCNTAIFASNASFWLSNSVIPQINTVNTNTSNTLHWLSNTSIPSICNLSVYTSNTLHWVSNSILPTLSENIIYSSNTTTWLSNNLIEPSIYAYNISSWLSNTSIPFTSNSSIYSSNIASWLSNIANPWLCNTSTWASNTSTQASNISFWLSNNIIPNTTSNVDFASNTSSWLSNISIPIVSNIAVFGSNSSYWLSNLSVPWLCNASIFSSNNIDFLSNTSLPWVSNATVYSSNTIYWLSNTSVPLVNTTAQFGSNTTSWLSNISIPISSNMAVFGSNTSSWLSNTAIVWASNTSIAASNRAFISWSNSSCNIFLGSDSNVGIGTTSPTTTFEVVGISKTTTLLTNELQVVGSSTKPIDNLIALRSLNPTLMDGSLSNTAAVYGGGPGAVYDSNIEAWRFVNDSNTKKITWYFFGNSNANNTLYRYKNLRTAYYKIRFNGSNIPNSGFWPVFSIYSLPLGDGKDAAVWYRARMNYFTYTDSNVQLGKDYCFYINEDPTTAGFLNVVCDKKIKVHFSSNQFSAFIGPSNETRIQDTNVMEYITIQTNSSAVLNTVDFTMTEMGFRFGTEISRFITCFSSN